LISRYLSKAINELPPFGDNDDEEFSKWIFNFILLVPDNIYDLDELV